jgi:hypothetical protein
MAPWSPSPRNRCSALEEEVAQMTGAYAVPRAMRSRFIMFWAVLLALGIAFGYGAVTCVLRLVHQPDHPVLDGLSLLFWVAGLVFLAVGAAKIHTLARSYIARVDWGAEGLTLGLYSGPSRTVSWDDVEVLRVAALAPEPPSTGHAYLLLRKGAGAYGLPLAPTPDCQSLLNAFAQKTHIERVSGETFDGSKP